MCFKWEWFQSDSLKDCGSGKDTQALPLITGEDLPSALEPRVARTRRRGDPSLLSEQSRVPRDWQTSLPSPFKSAYTQIYFQQREKLLRQDHAQPQRNNGSCGRKGATREAATPDHSPLSTQPPETALVTAFNYVQMATITRHRRETLTGTREGKPNKQKAEAELRN